MASKTIEQVPVRPEERLPRHARLLLRLSRRELPPPICQLAVERGIGVPAGDGVIMVTDHYRPLAAGPHPTLLVRSPYGARFPLRLHLRSAVRRAGLSRAAAELP